jgi:hypothetical protein
MNPEFVRNLWLETTPRRIAWAGLAVVLILFASGVLFGHTAANASRLNAVGIAGLIVFLVAALLWGGREAGRAVRIEIGERTWDFQRLSALTPWAMTWGKLFGATSLAWLAALVGLIAAIPLLVMRAGPTRAIEAIVGAIALAVLLQGAALAGSLVAVRKARAEGRLAVIRGGIGGFFAGLAMLWVVWQGLSLAFVMARGGQTGLGRWAGLDPHVWWSVNVAGAEFVVASLAAYAAWAVAGGWRLMRLELQLRNAPWLWIAFLVFTALYLAGFAGPADVGSRFALMAGVFAAGAYIGAFIDPADRVGLRQFAQQCRQGDWRAARYRTPLAAPALLLTLLAVIGFSLQSSASFPGASPAFGFAALAFLVRDLGVIAFFRFGPRPARGDLGAVLALFLLYAVGGAVGALGGDAGRAFFRPDTGAPLISLVAAAVQALIIWVLAIGRIRRPEGA